MRGTVVDLDSNVGTLTLETAAGARRTIPTHYAAEHVDHAYALTGHAAQGTTVERAFVLLPDRGALREWGYTACTRARTETRLYLGGEAPAPEREHHGRPIDRRSPPARLADALEQSAAERTALEQNKRPPSDASRRAVERRRRECDRALEEAEQRLAAAHEELSGLGRLGHRRERIELQAKISLRRTVLRLARKQLDTLPHEPPEPRRPLASRPPRLERTPPVLGRPRELDRGLGLEL
jgi:hypothetical protein